MSTRIFSWLDSGVTAFTPFIRLDYRYPNDRTWGIDNKAKEIAQTQPGKRIIYIHGLGRTVSKDELFDVSDPAGVVRRGGYYMPAKQYCRRLFEALKALKVSPDFIVLDYEGGFELWRIAKNPGQEWKKFVQAVFDDPKAKQVVPEDIRQHNPDVFTSWKGLHAIVSWDRWAAKVRAEALRIIVTDTAKSVFGHPVNCGNHADYQVGNQIVDGHFPGTPFTGDFAVDGITCPCFYLQPGKFGRYTTLKKPPRWNLITTYINLARACVNRVGPDNVKPWIAPPQYNGDYDPPTSDHYPWIQLMRHLKALGINEYLYFNGCYPAEVNKVNDQIAAKYIDAITKSVKEQQRPVKGWQMIPYDSEQIKTGSIISNIADYNPNQPQDESSSSSSEAAALSESSASTVSSKSIRYNSDSSCSSNSFGKLP